MRESDKPVSRIEDHLVCSPVWSSRLISLFGLMDRVRPFEKFATLFEQLWNGTSKYYTTRIRVKLGLVEGLNYKICVIHGCVYDYRDEEYRGSRF